MNNETILKLSKKIQKEAKLNNIELKLSLIQETLAKSLSYSNFHEERKNNKLKLFYTHNEFLVKKTIMVNDDQSVFIDLDGIHLKSFKESLVFINEKLNKKQPFSFILNNDKNRKLFIDYISLFERSRYVLEFANYEDLSEEIMVSKLLNNYNYKATSSRKNIPFYQVYSDTKEFYDLKRNPNVKEKWLPQYQEEIQEYGFNLSERFLVLLISTHDEYGLHFFRSFNFGKFKFKNNHDVFLYHSFSYN